MKQPWYQFRAQADPSVAELHILDVIYPDKLWDGVTTAVQLVKDLAALGEDVKTVRVHINSPGGDVFTALNIANALRDQRATKGRTVETIVDGLAASAASLVLMAGAPAKVADNAMVMVHNPWSIAIGNAEDMLKAASDLEQIRGALLATYKWHSSLTEDEIKALMDAETWMSAEEAVANGFADEIVQGLQAQASIEPGALAKLKVPERFAARVAELTQRPETVKPAPPPAVATLDEIVALCRAAGLDLEFAAQLAGEGLTPAAAEARVSSEKASRVAEDRRQTDIRALCARFKADVLVPEMISGGMAFEAARALVGKVKAMLDTVEIDAGLSPQQGSSSGSKAALNVQDVYEARRPQRH